MDNFSQESAVKERCLPELPEAPVQGKDVPFNDGFEDSIEANEDNGDATPNENHLTTGRHQSHKGIDSLEPNQDNVPFCQENSGLAVEQLSSRTGQGTRGPSSEAELGPDIIDDCLTEVSVTTEVAISPETLIAVPREPELVEDLPCGESSVSSSPSINNSYVLETGSDSPREIPEVISLGKESDGFCDKSETDLISEESRDGTSSNCSVVPDGNLCARLDQSDMCSEPRSLNEVVTSQNGGTALGDKDGGLQLGLPSQQDASLTTEGMVYGCEKHLCASESGCCDLPEVDESITGVSPQSGFSSSLATIVEVSSAEAEVRGEELPKGDSDASFMRSDKRRLSTSRLKRSSLQGSLRCKKTTEVALLVEQHLKDVVVPFESVKAQLVRQSRDILLCRFQGHFSRFRDEFLLPAAALLKKLKDKHPEPPCFCGRTSASGSFNSPSSGSCPDCSGWPLCFNRRLVINLGELDEALLKPGDFYVCLRESRDLTPSAEKIPSNPSTDVDTSFRELPSPDNQPTTDEQPELPSGASPVAISSPESDFSKVQSELDKTLDGISEASATPATVPCVESDTCCIISSEQELTANPLSCEAPVYLSIRYRVKLPHSGEEVVRERRIDEKDLGSLFSIMDWMESGESDGMISDDHLTTVLQHLLLSVERGIERLEWAGVTKPWPSFGGQTSSSARCCHGSVAHTKDSSVQTNADEELTSPETTAAPGDPELETPACCLTAQNGGLVDDQGLVSAITSAFSSPADRDGSKAPPPPDEVMVRLSSGALQPALDEDPDDGYYEHTLAQPTSLSQLDEDALRSEIALLPGCRDVNGRSVVVISSGGLAECPSVTACHLAQLLLYFHTIPKKEVVSRGFLVLVDALEAGEEFWNVLDEAFYLIEGSIPTALGHVVLLRKENQDTASFFPSSRVQCEVVTAQEQLLCFVRKEQLPSQFGGTYAYDHKEWMSFRKFLEPFVNGCRLSGRHLVALLEDLRGSRPPPSSALTHQLIEQQQKSFRSTFQDEQLRHLEQEGDTILRELESFRARSPHNADYRENLDRTRLLYDRLRKAMTKLSELADKRLLRLEQCLQMRTFQEESSQVLAWLCRKGTESLEKHQSVADSLCAIKEQEEEFEKFYFLAMRQIERGNDLLEEVSMLGHEPSLPKIREESQSSSDDDSGIQELAASLKHHLGSFSEKLEGTRELIEDTAKCYQLMDKSYEWALDAMRFVSQMGLSNTGNTDGIAQQIRCLQEYLDDHVPVSDDTFQEILDLAEKLNNTKLSEQCKVAKLRCQETVELIHARLKTLHKVKQQIEVDPFRGHAWDDSDNSPVPRTSRSHSQPLNMWTPSSSTPYPLCLGHHRRRSDSNAMSSVPASYGSPMGSYTSFPSSYCPTAKETYPLDSFLQEKEQILHRGLITEDLTCQGPVTSISRGVLDSRINHRDSVPSSSSTISSCKNITSVLRSSGRGTYTCNSSGGVNIRWSKRHSRKSQMWQQRDEALEKIKKEVREQNDMLHVETLRSENSDSISHSSEADFSSSSENSCKVPSSHARTDPVRGPVPVNTHLLSPTSSSDMPDGTGANVDVANDADAKGKKTLMLIMKEMIQTERDYVKSLEYIIENYIPELLREDIPQALRGQRNVVFGNIEKIFEFHSQYFLNELEQYENAPFFAGQCFLKYEPQFYLYALYNKNKPKSDALMLEYGNAFFRKKQLELEDKMDLASYLLKPVQRMGKYALLLKQLLKECPEQEPEHQDLKAAEEMVRFQLRHGNDLLAMDALRDCDVNVKEQGRLLRQDEFLVWQGRSRKSLRHVFLFEDLILFSKARRDPQKKGYEMYQYKHSIKTTDMGLTEQVGDSPSKFEIWFRKRKLNDTYVLQAPTPDVKAAWVHELSKLLWKQALRNREMRLAEMSSMGIGNKPCLDIKPSEDQINDRSISVHQLSRAPRFRNSFGMPSVEQKLSKRPHSIISVSSSSSSGSSQSSFTFYGTLNLGFEPGDSPRPLHRSLTQQSQCSTESGFCTDASTAGDSPTDCERVRHKKAERSDSLLSSDSMSTSTTPSELNCSPCDEQVIEESITTSM